MLLDPGDWSLVQSSDRVLAELSDELARHASPETHAAVIELATDVNTDVAGIAAQLASLRGWLSEELAVMGLAAAASGTHPSTVWRQTAVSGGDRYRRLSESMRVLALREPTMALHVHVGVPEPEDAIKLLNGLRRNIPVLLALSGNSPFWQGRDTGFDSSRTFIFQAFPRTGIPPFFAGYADYVEAVDALIAPQAVSDPSYLWWDVRLQPALGTVEVRVMDAQSTVPEVAALVALIQSLSRLELEGESSLAVLGAEALAENRFLAARDGMHGRLIDQSARSMIPVGETLSALLGACRPHARALGCADALDGVRSLETANGADRQRALAAGDRSLDDLVARLAGRFLAPHRLAAAAAQPT